MPERKLNFINDDAFHLVFTGDSVRKRWPELWRCFAKRGDRAVWWPSFLSDDFMSRFSFVAGLVGFPSIIGLFALRFRIGRLRAIIVGLEATVAELKTELREAESSLTQARRLAETEGPGSRRAMIERDRVANRLDRASESGWSFFEERAQPIALMLATRAEYLISMRFGKGRTGGLDYEATVVAGLASIIDPDRFPFDWLPNDLDRLQSDPNIDLNAEVSQNYIPRREDAERTLNELARLTRGQLLDGEYSSIIIPIAQRAIAIAMRYPELGLEREWAARFDLAQALLEKHRVSEAIQLCEEAARVLVSHFRPSSDMVLSWRRLRANAHQSLGQWDEATNILRENHATSTASLGSTHESTVVASMSLIASQVRSDPETAVSASAALLEQLVAVFGPAHSHLVNLRNVNAEALEAVGRTGDAIAVYLVNFSLIKERYGTQHPYARRVKTKLAQLGVDL